MIESATANGPPASLPSIEQLQELLLRCQGALAARLGPPAEDWKGFARQAAGLLPFLWAGYRGDPFRWFDDKKDDDAILPAYFLPEETGRRFHAHARQVGAEAAAAAVILADVAESLDLATLPGPVLLDETLDAVVRGDFDLRARAEELLAAIREETEPPAAVPGLPDPTVLATLLRHIHPPGPDRQAPLWPQVIHRARCIALFDRLVPREDWKRARTQLGRHGTAAAAVTAMVKQSLGLVSDPAGSLRGTVAMALKRPATLDRSARKLIKTTARLALLPEPGSLEVDVPSLERARALYDSHHWSWPMGPDAEECSWLNLHDRMMRIHLRSRLGRKADLKEANELLGQRVFTVVAMLALSLRSCSYRHSRLVELSFETAVRMATAGALDLDGIVSAREEHEQSRSAAAFADPLKPVPDIHDIRGLIPETRWAPVSAEPRQRHGWASVIYNARRLGREALGIDDGTWTRLENRIGARSAAAAVLHAAPRPQLAPEPRLIDRIAGLRSRYDRDWSASIHARALDAIGTEIDLAIVAALENSDFQPEAPELLPGPDVLKEHGPRSIRELVGDSSEPDWDELTAVGHDLSTGRLGLPEDDWRRACRILGTRRAAAAALAAAAFQEERARKDFAGIVFHEATRPGSLPELLRDKWVPYVARDSFALSDSASEALAL